MKLRVQAMRPAFASRSARAEPCHWSKGRHRPLSRRLDRCDRVIQKESGDPNGGNMCSFSGATGTSQYVTMHITFLSRKSAFIYRRGLRQRVASLTLDCNGVFAIRAYNNVGVSLLERRATTQVTLGVSQWRIQSWSHGGFQKSQI